MNNATECGKEKHINSRDEVNLPCDKISYLKGIIINVELL